MLFKLQALIFNKSMPDFFCLKAQTTFSNQELPVLTNQLQRFLINDLDLFPFDIQNIIVVKFI